MAAVRLPPMSDGATAKPPELGGGDMLARLSDEMVRAKKKFFGKGPEQAKSYMLDDMLFVVMRGGLTTAEQTMLRFGRQDMVREFRQLFENEMTEVLTGIVEETTGLRVVNYQSQIMFDPDLIVEMFVFDQPRKDGIQATAADQVERQPTGAAADSQALDTPPEGESSSGLDPAGLRAARRMFGCPARRAPCGSRRHSAPTLVSS